MNKKLSHYLSLDYPVEIRRIEEELGGGYVATIPCLGSIAFVGDGDTPQEAYENLMAAKAEIFEEYLQAGLPIPAPPREPDLESYSGKLVVRMPRELHAKLAQAAHRNETSLNQYIISSLSQFVAGWDAAVAIKSMWESTMSGVTTQGRAQPAPKDSYVFSGPLIKPQYTQGEQGEDYGHKVA